MVLSSAEYSMAVMAAFPLSFVAILSRGPFSINADILGFSQNCSYTVLALSFRRASGMPRTESSSAMSQGYLDFYYMSSAISLLCSDLGSQCKNGLGSQIIGPHNYLFNSFCFCFYFSLTSLALKKSLHSKTNLKFSHSFHATWIDLSLTHSLSFPLLLVVVVESSHDEELKE